MRKGRVIGISFGLLTVLLLAVLALAGNFLFEFALDPHAENSMSAMMSSGDVDGLDMEEQTVDAERAESRRRVVRGPVPEHVHHGYGWG